jgi:hypothetical protein
MNDFVQQVRWGFLNYKIAVFTIRGKELLLVSRHFKFILLRKNPLQFFKFFSLDFEHLKL